MIVSLIKHATPAQIDEVADRIRSFGFRLHQSPGAERSVMGAIGVGGDLTACLESLRALPQVERAVPISAPYKFVSREYREHRTVVRIPSPAGPIDIGGDDPVVMAGPCSVESEAQIMETAERVAAAGARILRGGAFKPRTSPYEFQGLAEDGLALLARARERTGLAIVTEVMTDSDVALVEQYTDLFQVGSRNMQNFALLKALGRSRRPVLLKRGLSSTIKEWLMAAEYVVGHGNPNVIFCERGIRTFETATRNTCDLAAVPLLNELTHLPVIVDPSHATGKRSLVPAVARAAIAIGADGLMVEAHPAPEKAWSDGAQSLSLDEFDGMMRMLESYRELWRQSRLELAYA
ncbi:MAG: 3-deoxy-7-phosphoheptulonate synthase [Bryobacteraceae bacterium]|nr:3-deoxy-7-phosphoheptulonate synthase [Bryobacteraceae bacterium]